jgi:hypothetical protein
MPAYCGPPIRDILLPRWWNSKPGEADYNVRHRLSPVLGQRETGVVSHPQTAGTASEGWENQ